MSKKIKLVDIENAGNTVKPSSEHIDWNECMICQERTQEDLQCPADNKRINIDIGAGYQSFDAIIHRCCALNWFPSSINLEQLNEGDGIARTLQNHKAKWHKSCRNKYSDLKISRREKRKQKPETEDTSNDFASKVTRQSCGDLTRASPEGCFFCGDISDDLHDASIFMIDKRVRECALELQDTVLLAKLSIGDLISQEAKYHAKCLIKLYNKAKRQTPKTKKENQESVIHGIVLAELIEYIDGSRSETDILPIFKLADLAKLYSKRIEQLGIVIAGKINTTHLKNRILAAIPDLQAHKQGRDVLLIFNDDVGEALKQATSYSCDDEGLIIAKAAKIVRRDMFDTRYSFKGTFTESCQHESVPQTLVSLVRMILGGPNIETQSSNVVESQTTLTISQLLQFNSAVRRRKSTAATYHTSDREPPLPIYLGMVIHAETRKRDLVDKLYNLGLGISYDRVMNISTAMGNSICEMFKDDDVVCPAKLRCDVFTTAAVDNIDHNPSSTSAKGSLHETAISLFQHPSQDNYGTVRAMTSISENVKRDTIKPLPERYSVVPPVVLPKEPTAIPSVDSLLFSECGFFSGAQQLEYRWLNHVRQEIEDDGTDNKNVTWSAFHANLSQTHAVELPPLDISSVLPLFQEEAKSTAMIRHSMTIIKECVSFLNPGQIPVMACDQPLYALAKNIQWNWPARYGETHIVIMFGGLHIEIAALRTIGDWLQNSGWVNALSQSNVASAGTAESFLKASHVTRTRHAHQVTACSLHMLMHKAYRQYLDTVDDQAENTISFEEWKERREIESHLFHFWSLTLKLELIILIFVRSLREGNFTLYKDSLTMLIPWFFALDHPNYARWLPIHVRDMFALDTIAPSIATEFESGHFVVHKTHSTFSAIAIDHAHEQNNKLVKGEGGVIGLTENASQLLRWMVCGPEMARAVNEFELSQELIKHEQSKGPNVRHHEQVESKQKAFVKQVIALTATIEEMGNPFLEESEDLLVLDTRDIVDPKVANTVRNIEQIGNDKYHEYVRERLDKRTTPLSDPIKQNKLHLFSRQELRSESKEKRQISSLKQNCSLFSQLYVSCQVRDSDLDEFFRHENQAYPPSLSQFGQLRLGSKSDLLLPLEKMCVIVTEIPDVDAIILDGAVIVNILKPRFCKTFEDYSKQVFLPHINNYLKSCSRIDVIWDEYRQDSLKASTRGKRGKGIRRRVQADSTIPGNWESFLRIDDNKTELFAYLAEQLLTLTPSVQTTVVSTKGSEVVCNKPDKNKGNLSPCNHEEADTRILLHVADAVKSGIQKIMIRTVDTDVVVIAVSAVHKLNITSLWMAFGVGKNFRYIPVHEKALFMGPSKSNALLFFHAFSGCDQVSSFSNRGKKTAWDTWLSFNAVTEDFKLLSDKPNEDCVNEAVLNIERFVVLMYDRTSECLGVDAARKDLFTRKGRSIENIPPSSAALHQHIKRAAYQAGFCWGQALVKLQESPSPSIWGWKRNKEGLWEPFWTSLQQASESCAELIKCGCKSENGCRGRCKCVKASLSCTALCKCGGQCDRD